MRNAVIRKKRLKAEHIVDAFMRMPQRVVLGAIEPGDLDWASIPQQRLWPMGANAPI